MPSVVRTSCPRDCPDACGILTHVEHGKVVRLAGDPDHPVTRGFLCERTSRFVARQNSPDRLTSPLLRKHGQLVPVSWNEALDTCARELVRIRAESGPAAIFHYRGGGSLGVLKGLSDLLFDRFGPVTSLRGSVCDGAGSAAQRADFGLSDASDPQDLANARVIVLWGKNPATSSPHLLPPLIRARQAGATVVLIDPIRHRSAMVCDHVFQPRPGGDLALALGIAQIAFERGWSHPNASSWCDHLEQYRSLVRSRSVEQWASDAGLPVQDLTTLAELITQRGPTTVLVGWGMQRRTNGAAIVRAIDALGAITGNIGVPGAGVSFYFQRRAAFDLTALRTSPPPRSVREPLLARDIADASDPPIRAVWICCANPAAMLPDSHAVAKVLSSRELVIVVDAFLTETARLASVVLPSTTFLEDDDLVGAYGHHYVGVVQPAVKPPPGVRSDLEILQALAPRLGLAHVVLGSADDWKRRVLRGISLEALRQGPVRNPSAPYVAFEGRRFPTATGRASLLHELPEARSRVEGLVLAALSTPPAQCSQWSPSEPTDLLLARIHPDSQPGLADGSSVTLRSSVGSLRVRVQLDACVRPGLVVVPKGGSPSLGRGANALLSAQLTDMGEGAALYEEPVTIEP